MPLPSLHVFNGQPLGALTLSAFIGSLSHSYPHVMWGPTHATRARCPAKTRHVRVIDFYPSACRRPPACHALPSDTTLERLSLRPVSSAAMIPCSRQPPPTPPSAPPKQYPPPVTSPKPCLHALAPLSARGSPSFAWREATVQPPCHQRHGYPADLSPPSHSAANACAAPSTS